MKKTGCFLTAVLVFLTLQAEMVPQITNIPNRETISLNGTWRAITDLYGTGGGKNGGGFGYASDTPYNDRTRLQEYDYENAPVLRVPGDWNTQREKLYYFEGVMWYRRHFNYNKKNDKRLFLHFEGANYETSVFLNGKPLGTHTGGFTPFTFEITDQVNAGDNSLVVRVDAARRDDGIPTKVCDWWNYGGITRNVSLLETPMNFIHDHYVQLKKNDKSTIEAWVKLDGTDKTEKEVTLTIPELKTTRKAMTDSSGIAKFEFRTKPELWSPESPRLYDIKIATDTDTITDEVGFRTLRTEGAKILLNDKEIFCRGINIHEEAPFTGGRAFCKEQDEILLDWAKELGCNFVRLAHYPHNEAMVRAAEKKGLMVWSEIPLYWGIDWDSERTYANAENQLSEMIDRDKNRCNVIIWSIANETAVRDNRMKFLTRLAEKAHSLDNTRLVAAAMQNREVAPGKMVVDDPLSEVIDVMSFNEYVGWYDGTKEKCDTMEWKFRVEKPVIISEYGGCAQSGLHGSSDEFFTEEYQADLYRHQIDMLKRMPGLAGSVPWILMDFRSPRRQLGVVQDDFNRKGLISDQGEKKLAFKVLQQWYEELAKLDKER